MLTLFNDLVDSANRFRSTPIVDDDFPEMRDEFDDLLEKATKFLSVKRPKIVCLCGSTRFWKEFQEANYRETMAGNIVLTVGHYPNISKQRFKVDGCMGEQEVMAEVVGPHGQEVGCTPEQKIALDELHKRKIDLADEVFVLNVGGYIGQSTRSEIEYAKKHEKPIRYLEQTDD